MPHSTQIRSRPRDDFQLRDQKSCVAHKDVQTNSLGEDDTCEVRPLLKRERLMRSDSYAGWARSSACRVFASAGSCCFGLGAVSLSLLFVWGFLHLIVVFIFSKLVFAGVRIRCTHAARSSGGNSPLQRRRPAACSVCRASPAQWGARQMLLRKAVRQVLHPFRAIRDHRGYATRSILQNEPCSAQ